MRPKYIGGKFLSILMCILVFFKVYIVCVHELEY
jgi:hypothetical protein